MILPRASIRLPTRCVRALVFRTERCRPGPMLHACYLVRWIGVAHGRRWFQVRPILDARDVARRVGVAHVWRCRDRNTHSGRCCICRHRIRRLYRGHRYQGGGGSGYLGNRWRGSGGLRAGWEYLHRDDAGQHHRDCRDEAQADHVSSGQSGITICGGHALSMQAEAHGIYLRGRYGSS